MRTPQSRSPDLNREGIPWPLVADMVGRTVPWVFLVICNMN